MAFKHGMPGQQVQQGTLGGDGRGGQARGCILRAAQSHKKKGTSCCWSPAARG